MRPERVRVPVVRRFDLVGTCRATIVDHYEAFFRSVARRNPPPNISSNGRDLDRGFIKPEEREALLAYLRRL